MKVAVTGMKDIADNQAISIADALDLGEQAGIWCAGLHILRVIRR